MDFMGIRFTTSNPNHIDQSVGGSSNKGTRAPSIEVGPKRFRGSNCPRKKCGVAPVVRNVRRSLKTSENSTESPRLLVNSMTYSPSCLQTSALHTQSSLSGWTTMQVTENAFRSTTPRHFRKPSTNSNAGSTSRTASEMADTQPSGSEQGLAIVPSFE